IGGGLAKQMPTLFYIWMLACLANLGLPMLSGFVAEATVLYGSIMSPMANLPQSADFVHGVVILAATGVIFTAGYMLWLLKRLFFGPEQEKWQGHLTDAKSLEVVCATILAVFIFALGIYPLALTNQYAPLADRMAKETSGHTTI